MGQEQEVHFCGTVTGIQPSRSDLFHNDTQETAPPHFEGVLAWGCPVEFGFHVRHTVIVKVDGAGLDQSLRFGDGGREAE
jgi:hypothetical protein